jgi:quinol-cytochrome oxidoreductase complex cytochrome b subunit
MGAFDLLAMAIMILPFMIVPWLDRSRPLKRVTRWAWILSAVMALDLVFFTSGTLGPFGSGHPSLEALGSSFLGIAKPVLVPVTLVLLGIACIKGERMLVVSLGFLCLAAETLYAVYPMTG